MYVVSKLYSSTLSVVKKLMNGLMASWNVSLLTCEHDPDGKVTKTSLVSMYALLSHLNRPSSSSVTFLFSVCRSFLIRRLNGTVSVGMT